MANFFTRLFSPQFTSLQESDTVAQLETRNTELRYHADSLVESMRELSLFIEDYEWIPITGWEENNGFSLETIKEQADRCQALLSVNPVIKKAASARTSMIWGKGLTYKGTSVKKIVDDPNNQLEIFSDIAHEEIERLLMTDGNIFAAVNNNTSKVFIVPINQIAGIVTDPENPSRVLYFLRKYDVREQNFSGGNPEVKHIEVFYPAEGTTGTAKTIQGIKIERNITLVHRAVNRQKGWIWGLPDIMAAMFWVRAHKELFESGTAFVKAQGKYASKVISKTSAGAQRAAAAVAEAPRRDPDSGEILDIGGTAVMSAGLDMQLMGKMSGGVDFAAFEPVLALVAASLDVPVSVLTASAQKEEETLEQSVVMAMKTRQKVWSSFFSGIFGSRKVETIWPKIKTEQTFRQIQALEIVNKTNVLHRPEMRGLALEAFELQGDPNDLPDLIKDQPQIYIPVAVQDNAAEHAQAAAEAAAEVAATVAATTPEQGVDAGVGKLSTGKDAKDSRDKGEQSHTKK
jgi:hypothetical protein